MTRRIFSRTGAALGVLACAVALPACSKKEEAPKPSPAPAEGPAGGAAAEPPGATHDAPHDPHAGIAVMKGDGRVTKMAEGTIEMTIDGTPQRLAFLPFGRNSAVWVPDKKIARINIGASESDAGPPSLSIVLVGQRLDALKLPQEFGPSTRTGQGEPPPFRMTWQVGEKRIYRTLDRDTSAGINKLVLEQYEDGRLEGRFEGRLVMGNGKADKPLHVTGAFDVKLRLNGVEPNRTAESG